MLRFLHPALPPETNATQFNICFIPQSFRVAVGKHAFSPKSCLHLHFPGLTCPVVKPIPFKTNRGFEQRMGMSSFFGDPKAPNAWVSLLASRTNPGQQASTRTRGAAFWTQGRALKFCSIAAKSWPGKKLAGSIGSPEKIALAVNWG